MRNVSVADSIEVIKRAILSPIAFVVDVGVMYGTSFLMSKCKDSHHFLFEPCDDYHDSICNSYKRLGIDHTLIKAAVSNRNGTSFIHSLSHDVSGSVTHNSIYDSPRPEKFGDKLIKVCEVETLRLDDYVFPTSYDANFLVKIDVDGLEDLIIEGGRRTIKNSCVLIVETPISMVSDRIQMLAELDQCLFDICGHGYYDGQLQQVDLVFINKRNMTNINFRPFERTKVLVHDLWFSVE